MQNKSKARTEKTNDFNSEWHQAPQGLETATAPRSAKPSTTSPTKASARRTLQAPSSKLQHGEGTTSKKQSYQCCSVDRPEHEAEYINDLTQRVVRRTRRTVADCNWTDNVGRKKQREPSISNEKQHAQSSAEKRSDQRIQKRLPPISATETDWKRRSQNPAKKPEPLEPRKANKYRTRVRCSCAEKHGQRNKMNRQALQVTTSTRARKHRQPICNESDGKRRRKTQPTSKEQIKHDRTERSNNSAWR
jgi:hypothetical protein